MENLVVNGGGEVGDLSGWTVVPSEDSTHVSVVSSPTPPEGSKAFQFRFAIGTDEGDRHITQYFPTVQGALYEGEIYYNGEDGDMGGGGNNLIASVLLDLEGSGFGTTVQSFGFATVPTWERKPFTFVALGPTTGIRLLVHALIPSPTLRVVKFYLDGLNVPSLAAAPVLGDNVTFSDLLDSIQFDAGDFSSTYRNNARTWLNLVRSYIAGQGFWRAALRGSADINIGGSNADGIYPMKDAANQVWSHVDGNILLNVTDNRVVSYRDPTTIGIADPNEDNTGGPYHWTDKGYNDAGQPLIGLFPRPTVSTTLRGSLYKQYAAITDAQDGLTIDPFFGPIDDWAHCFIEGLRYYKEQDENEQGTQAQWGRFVHWVEQRKRKQGLPSAVAHRLRNLRGGGHQDVEPPDAVVNPLLLV